MKNLLKQPTVIASIVILLLAIIVWWFFLVSPAQNKLASIHQQEQQDQSQILSLQNELNTLEAEKGTIHKELPFITKVFPVAFPYNPQRPAIVLQLSKLATKNNLTLQTVSNFNLGNFNGYVDDTISMTVQGTYSNDYAFLQQLYTLKRVFTIQSLQISGSNVNILDYTSPSTVTFSLTVNAYTDQPSSGTVPPSSFKPLTPKKK
ncbi:MAG: type 4a pilus biogenesis protein PilO [Firmicutes bacterium]|jgi:Tfp pilus assembly protein PilO|nr:type 4a pilus biogenesis protein PilO [Bacillota bacterium]